MITDIPYIVLLQPVCICMCGVGNHLYACAQVALL